MHYLTLICTENFTKPRLTGKTMAMADKCGLQIPLLLHFFLFSIVTALALPPLTSYDVTRYGAVADGRTDNSKAFLMAWNDACKSQGRNMVWIPRGTYYLESVTFVGRCGGPVVLMIKGTLVAPTDPSKFFSDTWIGFRYVDYLVIKGGGYLDGQGSSAWKYNDCSKNSDCKSLPATLRLDFVPNSRTLRLDFVTNSRVSHLRSINSKNIHINLFACDNLNISNVRLTAPADSPNTDGIHIGASTKIGISRALIGTGDDCISMVSGSRDIHISGVTCGPGHGISIGSLGRGWEQEYVDRITVRDSTFIGTDNGVRIKTWAPSSYTLASNIVYKNIAMKDVKNPIVIDQQYCPYQQCVEETSSVQLEKVTFQNIWGVSSSQVAVKLQCSRARPCKNVRLIDINLQYKGQGKATAMCSHVLGASYGQQNPDGCL